MKIQILFTLVFCFLISTTTAQDCEGFFPFEEGTSFEITGFDKKGKKSSRSVYEVLEVTDNDQVANYATEMFDDKDESVMKSNFTAECTGDGIIIDVSYLMNPDMMKSYGDMELEVSGNNLSYPASLSEGQTLPDANLVVAINLSPIKMNIKLDITNRKVVGKETVTTSAGSFECFVITYDSETKAGFKMKTKNKQWISQNVGVVKDEFYNDKGKLLGHSELTAYSN